MGVGFRNDTIYWYCTTIRCFDVIIGGHGAELPFLVSQTVTVSELLLLGVSAELRTHSCCSRRGPWAFYGSPFRRTRGCSLCFSPSRALTLKHTAQRFKLFTLSPTNSQLGREVNTRPVQPPFFMAAFSDACLRDRFRPWL